MAKVKYGQMTMKLKLIIIPIWQFIYVFIFRPTKVFSQGQGQGQALTPVLEAINSVSELRQPSTTDILTAQQQTRALSGEL